MKHNIIKLIVLLATICILSLYLSIAGLSATQVKHPASSQENAGDAEVAHHEEHTASNELGHSAEHNGEEHHIWWIFPGYEIVLGVLSCIYFALFIVIVPYFIGKNLEEHH